MCDLADKDAVQRLYWIKGLSPTQPLSILCASFADIAAYTQGFPAANAPGQPDLFRLTRQVLPGPVSAACVAPLQPVSCTTGMSRMRHSRMRATRWLHMVL